jgi:hypothetical protein
LHDKSTDFEDPDTGEIVRFYSSTRCSCHVTNYDATPFQLEIKVRDTNGNLVTETVTAYGTQREFFALERSKVPNPELEIYGGGNDHEIMSGKKETTTE